MNFSIYLDDRTGKRVAQAAARAGQSRNTVLRRAVSDWLERQGRAHWPPEVLNFKGIGNFKPFEKHRAGLRLPKDDPLA